MNPEEKCFRFKTIDVRNIRDEISKIKTSKGFGTDNISSYFLKLAISLEGSKFLHDWKTGRVAPIFKGDISDKSNYRPISVLPLISRLLVKLVFNQLYQYLYYNSLLSPNQSSFRR